MASQVVQELFAKLSLDVDTSPFEKFQSALGHLGKGLSGVGAAVSAMGAAVVGSAFYVAHLGDEIGDTAEKLGVTTDALQELRHAATFSDTSIQDLEQGLKFLSINAGQAAKGTDESAKTFSKLGVKLLTAAGQIKPTADLFEEVAGKIANLGSQSERNAALVAIFGKSGTQLAPLMNKGAAGIAQLRKEAHELGAVLDEETIAQAGEFDKSLKRLQLTFGKLMKSLGAPALKAVQSIIDKLVQIGNMEFVSRSLTLVSRLFSGLIDILGFLTSSASTFGTSLAAAFAGVLTLSPALSASLGLMAGTLARFALSAAPFVLIALALEDIYTYSQGGESVFGDWLQVIKPLTDELAEFGRLLTDIITGSSDVSPWRAMASFIFMTFDGIMQFFAGIADTFSTSLGDKIRAVSKVNVEAAVFAREGSFSNAAISGGAASPSAAAAVSSSNSTSSRTMNANISINVPPGSNQNDIAETVRKQLDDWSRREFSDAAVVGGAQ